MGVLTNISAVLEKGAKSYYCIDFKRRDKLDEKSLALALEKMKEVHLKCVEDRHRVHRPPRRAQGRRKLLQRPMSKKGTLPELAEMATRARIEDTMHVCPVHRNHALEI